MNDIIQNANVEPTAGIFNKYFYAKEELQLVEKFRQDRNGGGCFYCGKKMEKRLKCGKCKIAIYCSRECQSKDWKEGGTATMYNGCRSKAHKEDCKAWCYNVEADTKNGLDEHSAYTPISVLMRNVNFINEDDMQRDLLARQGLFFKEVARSYSAFDRGYGFKKNQISFQICCVAIPTVKFVALANFFDNQDTILTVSHVSVVDLGLGEEDVKNLMPDDDPDNPGDIPEHCREFVLTTLSNLVKSVHDNGLHVQGVTYGRGLMWLMDDQYNEKKEEIDEGNGMTYGVVRKIMWNPDFGYASYIGRSNSTTDSSGLPSDHQSSVYDAIWKGFYDTTK